MHTLWPTSGNVLETTQDTCIVSRYCEALMGIQKRTMQPGCK